MAALERLLIAWACEPGAKLKFALKALNCDFKEIDVSTRPDDEFASQQAFHSVNV